jgi:hypothetical protein
MTETLAKLYYKQKKNLRMLLRLMKFYVWNIQKKSVYLQTK